MHITDRAKRRLFLGFGAVSLATLLSVTTSLPASADGSTVVVPTVEKSPDASRATLIDLEAETSQWESLKSDSVESLLHLALTAGVPSWVACAWRPGKQSPGKRMKRHES
jgi:hypothetical protein